MENEDDTRIVKFNEFFDSKNVNPNVSNVEKYPPDGVDPEFTGLPMYLWIYTIGIDNHQPILEVQRNYNTKLNSNDCFVISISNNPKILKGDRGEISDTDLKKVFTWITKNEKILLNLWYMVIDDETFLDSIEKI